MGVLLFVTAWLVVGWLITFLYSYIDEDMRQEFQFEEYAVILSIVMWPIALAVMLGALIVTHLNPTSAAESLKNHRKTRANVIVKARRRGQED